MILLNKVLGFVQANIGSGLGGLRPLQTGIGSSPLQTSSFASSGWVKISIHQCIAMYLFPNSISTDKIWIDIQVSSRQESWNIQSKAIASLSIDLKTNVSCSFPEQNYMRRRSQISNVISNHKFDYWIWALCDPIIYPETTMLIQLFKYSTKQIKIKFK